jgi:predicted amidohydrolase
MKIAVASPPYPSSLSDCLYWIDKLSKEALQAGAVIVCFPETYLPGYPGAEYKREECTPAQLQDAIQKACNIAKENGIAIILPTDLHTAEGIMNVAIVISKHGEVLGHQTKNQLDPSEDDIWIPGTTRNIFEVEGLKFGIAICHEGFRYPEVVRWAARNGAHVVFHPNCTGSDIEGEQPTEWGSKGGHYYEKAQMVRALENTIYFAPSNYTFKSAHSASSIIASDGTCLAYQPYGEPGIAIADIDLSQATGFLAGRFKPQAM